MVDFEKLADLLDAFADKLDQETAEKHAAAVAKRKEEISPLLSKYERATGEKLAEEEVSSLLNASNEQFIDILQKMAGAIPDDEHTSLAMGKANTTKRIRKSAKQLLDEADRRFESWCKDPDSIYADSF